MANAERSEGSFLQPITRVTNPNTGAVWDDSGYDALPVEESGEPLVEIGRYSEMKGGPRVEASPAYDGFDYYNGTRDKSKSFPGQIGDGSGLYLRQSVAEGVIATDRQLRKMGMNLVLTDGWREPEERTPYGFTQTFLEKAAGKDVADVSTFFLVAKEANGYFSATKADTTSPAFVEFKRDLLANAPNKDAFEGLAKEFGMPIDDVVDKFITFCANIEQVRNHFPHAPRTLLNIKLPLSYDNSTHPTGGSFDTLIKNDGVIATPAGFDFFEREGGMDALEQMTFAELRQRYIDHPVLNAHCKSQFGIEPEKLEERHFNLMQAAMRALYHVSDAAGATHYLDEFQHKQFGNIVRDPATGNVIHKGALADKYPNAGNSCHSIQTMTRESAVAIYGGVFARQFVIDTFDK